MDAQVSGQGLQAAGDVDRVADDRVVLALGRADVARDDPSRAFALAHLSTSPSDPTPIGVFYDAPPAPPYEASVHAQIDAAKQKQGEGDLMKLLRSGDTWVVE